MSWGWRSPPGVGRLGVVNVHCPRPVVHLVLYLILVRDGDDRVGSTPFIGQFGSSFRGCSLGPDKISHLIGVGVSGSVLGIDLLPDLGHPLLHLVNIMGGGG